MKKFKSNKNKTEKPKWLIYIVLGIFLFIYVIHYSNWHFISKFVISIPILINLVFDSYYFTKAHRIVTELNFDSNELVFVINNKTIKKTAYRNLKYSIRKRKFDKHKTEIEFKKKTSFRFKTFARIHIKNWNDIFEIEEQMKEHKIQRVEWQPKTLWSKYWSIFIELFVNIAGDGGGLGGDLINYHEKSIQESTENPIKKNDN